jgi:hypothetical protein
MPVAKDQIRAARGAWASAKAAFKKATAIKQNLAETAAGSAGFSGWAI